MKKFFKGILFLGVFLSSSLVAEAPVDTVEERELSLFTEDVFNALREVGQQGKIEVHKNSRDPIIRDLAEKFHAAFKEGFPEEELQEAISELGRLVKCSADRNYCMPYTLKKEDLRRQVAVMEEVLRGSLPQNSNYHKLMIESLADKRWDIALYSYLKIAESRYACTEY